FFFFQAEDGIRDRTVTGVQTCALPISPRALCACPRTRAAVRYAGSSPAARRAGALRRAPAPARHPRVYYRGRKQWRVRCSTRPEIGRASCREREVQQEDGGRRANKEKE